MRLLDLRPRGAPVANYAARCSSLVVNGERVVLDRQVVAIIDTGTTGISVDERLLEADLVPSRWVDARIELQTERGSTVALDASVRRRQRASASSSCGSGRPCGSVAARPIPTDAEEFEEFPLVVSPIRVPWFDPGFGESECADGSGLQCNGRPLGAKPPLVDLLRQRADGLGEAPYVLFVGLSFLWKREVTIDVDDRRMAIV